MGAQKMSAWEQMQTQYFREMHDRWKTTPPEQMTEEEETDEGEND
jgi:hypothetical protein